MIQSILHGGDCAPAIPALPVRTASPSALAPPIRTTPKTHWRRLARQWLEQRWPRQLRAVPASVRFLSCEPLLGPLTGLNLEGIDWVIVGGESGSGHRAMEPAWARAIRDNCADVGVPFFFKQWGGRTPKANGRLLDGQHWDQMPAVA